MSKSVTIRCDRCSGRVWEDDMPDSKWIIELACLMCGRRKFYKRKEYEMLLKRAVEKRKSGSKPTSGGGALLVSG